MLPFDTLIHWLDSHAGAITALATVVLMLITAAYVLVTYLLVREQRLQGHAPDIARHWASVEGAGDADLRLHNVGNGAAVQVMIVRGPGSCIDAELPDLGRPRTILPGKDLVWRIRPADGASEFLPGELSLTLSWFDYNLDRVFFEVIGILMESEAEGVVIRDLGSAGDAWTRRKLKRLASKSLELHRRPVFWWRTRGDDLTVLLHDEEVRHALRAKLTKILNELKVWSKRAEAFRERL